MARNDAKCTRQFGIVSTLVVQKSPAKHDHARLCFAGHDSLITVLVAVVVPVTPVIPIPPVVPVAIPISAILETIPVVAISSSVVRIIRLTASERDQQRQGKHFFHDSLQMFMVDVIFTHYSTGSITYDGVFGQTPSAHSHWSAVRSRRTHLAQLRDDARIFDTILRKLLMLKGFWMKFTSLQRFLCW